MYRWLTFVVRYRLYTVLPRILEHLENLTNWYIRFNRDRLKGSGGTADTMTALNTLFDALFILIRALAPFAPFITDKIYRHLVPLLPSSLQAADTRCIHFLRFPQADSELLNPVVQRQVERMQKIIELGRMSRERHAIGLKYPLRTLVAIHPDLEYLQDVESLRSYIERELNILNLVTTSDEAQYGVQWSVTANWAVLGKKLMKNAKRVREGLAALPSEKLPHLLTAKTITIDGIEVDTADLIIRRSLKDADSTKWESNAHENTLTILDIESDDELRLQHLSRELVNRVQQVRKKAGLVPTDDIKIEYQVLKGHDTVNLESVIAAHGGYLQMALRAEIVKSDDNASTNRLRDSLILEEEQEIQHLTFLLRLLKL
jgi:isoleucyl-tRNA synthetase